MMMTDTIEDRETILRGHLSRITDMRARNVLLDLLLDCRREREARDAEESSARRGT